MVPLLRVAFENLFIKKLLELTFLTVNLGLQLDNSNNNWPVKGCFSQKTNSWEETKFSLLQLG